MISFNRSTIIGIIFIFLLSACGGGGGSGITNPLINLTNFQPASVVVGQTDFSVASPGLTSANTIYDSYGSAAVYEGRLYLGDSGNNRILGFNSIPSVNNTSANFALGQPDFVDFTKGISTVKFSGPQSITISGGKMAAASYGNRRALIWNSVPTSGGVPADIVVGAPDMDTAGSGACTRMDTGTVENVSMANGKLVVDDPDNNRVLIWTSVPKTDHAPANIVLGQQDFTHCAANDSNNDRVSDSSTAYTLSYPAGVWTDGIRIVVADNANNRVLIWNSFPTVNGQAADVVLGQGNFTLSSCNDDDENGVSDATPSARTLCNPFDGVDSDGSSLFITDNDNNRVLIWKSFPTNNFQPADAVLGQSDFIHSTANDDDQDGVDDSAPTARTLKNPTGVRAAGNKLIVNDNNNYRILIYEAP